MRKPKTILFFSAIVLIAAGTVGVYKYEAALRDKPVPPEPTIKEVQQAPTPETRPLLNTVALPSSAKRHLLDGNFNLVALNERIAQGCRTVFDSSFKPASPSQVELANPGQMFQSSDALIAGAPFRRLVFAGQRPGGCFIYYQHGGTMYPRFCLAVMDDERRKMLWVGEARKEAGTLDQLRKMLLRDDFMDTTGPAC